jgi:hypothetical protein
MRAAEQSTVAVFDWVLTDGTVVGLGTETEFNHWAAEGVLIDARLGRVIGQEPASLDAQRRAIWAAEATLKG